MTDQENNLKSLLKNRQYLWLFTSNVTFFFAMQAQIVMRSWLAYSITDSEFFLGLVAFAVAVPMFFLSPFGGVVSDKLDRRDVILWAQVAVFVADVVILILLLTNNIKIWHLLFSAAVNGCAFPFIMPARTAIIVNVVGKPRLEKAMALNMGGMNTTKVLGPALAGFLVDLVGVHYSYFLGVSLYGLGVIAMAQVKKTPPVETSHPVSTMRSMWEGAVYLKDNRIILLLLLFGLVPMFLVFPFQNLLVVFAEKVWDVGPRGFGLLSASMGVGGIVGAIWITAIKDGNGRLFKMMSSVIAFGLLLFCFSYSPWFTVGLITLFASNIFVNIFQTFNNTTVQLIIPDEVRGRVSGYLMMSASLPLLGTLPISALAEVYGVRFAVGSASILAVVIAILFYAFSPNLRRMDQLVLESQVIK